VRACIYIVVGIFTYVVFMHGHEILFYIIFLANSHSDTFVINTDEEKYLFSRFSLKLRTNVLDLFFYYHCTEKTLAFLFTETLKIIKTFVSNMKTTRQPHNHLPRNV
jgi:hypothetical protein